MRRRRITSWLLAITALLLSTGAVLAAPGRAAAPTPSTRAAAAHMASQPACAPGVALLGFSDALDKTTFQDTAIGGLSALGYDAATDVYYALVDNQGSNAARIYTLALPLASDGIGIPEVRAVTFLTRADGTPFTGEDLDAEGLALTRDGNFLISSEREPSIRRFGRDGVLTAELPVPERFRLVPDGGAEENRAFESLALSPDGQHVFTATEGPLTFDGFADSGGSRIRILRYDQQPDGSYQPAAEHYYLTEAGANVVDIIATSSGQLLVLERGVDLFTFFSGRIFSVSLNGAEDVSDQPELAQTTSPPLPKRILASLADCPGRDVAGVPMDNFEATTLGPRVGTNDTLLVVSDDNFSDEQVTRLVVLTVPAAPATTIRPEHRCGEE